jgi:hypothetical protein
LRARFGDEPVEGETKALITRSELGFRTDQSYALQKAIQTLRLPHRVDARLFNAFSRRSRQIRLLTEVAESLEIGNGIKRSFDEHGRNQCSLNQPTDIAIDDALAPGDVAN